MLKEHNMISNLCPDDLNTMSQSKEDLILDYLKRFKSDRGDKCGCSIVSISLALNIPLNEVKKALRSLYARGIIVPRKGINDSLIFVL